MVVRDRFRRGVPIDMQNEDLMILLGSNGPNLDHMLRAEDRDSVKTLVHWLGTRSFDVYLTGSVVRDHVLGRERGYDDIDLCAVVPVSGEKGEGVLRLFEDQVVQNRGINGIRPPIYSKMSNQGTFDYTRLGRPTDNSPHKMYVGVDEVHNNFSLRPSFNLERSGNVSQRRFSRIDLNMVKPEKGFYDQE